MQNGYKIYPSDMAGMVGLPHVGEIFYVDAANGNNVRDGKTAETAVATVEQAESLMTEYKHDVAIVVPTGSSTGRTTETAAVAWDKSFCHLVGSAAPTYQDARAGMNFGTGGSLTISDKGCIFANLTMFSSVDIDETVSVTGDYNSFRGCDFKGTSNATSIGSTPWRALNLNGAEENTFINCAIGGDTYTRSAANASLELEAASTRNVFDSCLFLLHTDDAAAVFVEAGAAADIDRFVWFKDCIFHNAVYSASTTITVGMTIHAAVGGSVILDGCSILGATDWSSDYTAVTGANMPDITAANAGFMERVAT